MIARWRLSALVLATAASLSAPPRAAAISAIDLVWRESGTNVYADARDPLAIIGDEVTVDVVLRADSAGIGGLDVSFVYDPFELDFVGGRELTSVNLPGMGNFFAPFDLGFEVEPFGNQTESTLQGLITGFDQVRTFGPGLIGATRTLGSFRFVVFGHCCFGGAVDPDLAVRLHEVGDAVVDASGRDAVVRLGFAKVPAPKTGALYLAGAIALGVLAAYRRTGTQGTQGARGAQPRNR